MKDTKLTLYIAFWGCLLMVNTSDTGWATVTWGLASALYAGLYIVVLVAERSQEPTANTAPPQSTEGSQAI